VSKARERPLLIGPASSSDQPLAEGGSLRGLKISELRRRATEVASVSEERVHQAEDSEDPRAALVALLLEAANAGPADAGAEHHLRDELRGMKMSALRTRARAAGVDEDEADEAGDGPSPAEAIVELIVAAELRGAVDEPAEDPAVTALRQELSGLRLKALKIRARELGVSDDALEAAEDEDDVNSAVTALCIDAKTAGEGEDQEQAALREELAPLKLKALKRRAREVGVSAAALDDADDSDDVKQAVTDLIISARQRNGPDRAAGSDRPHFGAAPAQPAQVATGAATASATAKHVMLSCTPPTPPPPPPPPPV
jgi:hypothetical protein